MQQHTRRPENKSSQWCVLQRFENALLVHCSLCEERKLNVVCLFSGPIVNGPTKQVDCFTLVHSGPGNINGTGREIVKTILFRHTLTKIIEDYLETFYSPDCFGRKHPPDERRIYIECKADLFRGCAYFQEEKH